MKKAVSLISIIFASQIFNLLIAQENKGYYDESMTFSMNFSVSRTENKVISVELPDGTTQVIFRISVGQLKDMVPTSLISSLKEMKSPYVVATASFMELGLNLSNQEILFYAFPSVEDANSFRSGGQFHFYKSTGFQTNSVVSKLTKGEGNYLHFGFDHNDYGSDYNVLLEVVPWVSTDTDWTSEVKQGVFEICKEEVPDELCYCLLSELENSISLKDFLELAEYEQEALVSEKGEKCAKELDIELVKSKEQEQAESYGRLGWKQFEEREYEKSIQYYDKSIELYPLGWVKANKGLSLLLLGRDFEASEQYVEAISLVKEADNIGYISNKIYDDLSQELAKNPGLSGAKYILELLESEFLTNTAVIKDGAVDSLITDLVFDTRTCDFETIQQGGEAVFTFYYENQGPEPINLLSAESDCGCVIVLSEFGIVPPGSKGFIKIMYDSSRLGPIDKKVTVVTDSGSQVLKVIGRVE